MKDPKKQESQYQHGNYNSIGHYQHDVAVVLESKHSLRMVGGRKANPEAKEKWARHELIGLNKYALAAIKLYRQAYEDNPYVDEALIKLEQRIQEAEEFLENKIHELKKHLLNVPENISIETVKSTKPFHLKPDFGGNPYANKGILLLASYDKVMTLMETCRAYGLIKRTAANDIAYQSGRFVRRVFVCPGEYVVCEISREDFRLGNDRSKSIASERSEPNPDVLAKRVIPEYGPKLDVECDEEIENVLSSLESLD